MEAAASKSRGVLEMHNGRARVPGQEWRRGGGGRASRSFPASASWALARPVLPRPRPGVCTWTSRTGEGNASCARVLSVRWRFDRRMAMEGCGARAHGAEPRRDDRRACAGSWAGPRGGALSLSSQLALMVPGARFTAERSGGREHKALFAAKFTVCEGLPAPATSFCRVRVKSKPQSCGRLCVACGHAVLRARVRTPREPASP